MKKEKLLLMIGTLLFVAGCTTETDEKIADKGTVSKIIVDASSSSSSFSNATSRTLTNGNSVTWNTGDQIALYETSGGITYKKFQLSSGQGNKSGYFGGTTSNDYLTTGYSWKVVYPYSAAQYDGSSARYRWNTAEISQNGDTNSHLANYDWLTSTAVAVSDGAMPAFTLDHSFALIKVTLDVEGIVEDDNYETYFVNLNMSTQNNEQAFASRIYIDEHGDLKVYSYTNSIVVVRTDKPWFENGTYTFWFVAKQNESVGIVPLILQPYFSEGSGGNVLWSISTTYTPSTLLEAGKLYNLNLKMTFNNESHTASTLEVIDN